MDFPGPHGCRYRIPLESCLGLRHYVPFLSPLGNLGVSSLKHYDNRFCQVCGCSSGCKNPVVRSPLYANNVRFLDYDDTKRTERTDQRIGVEIRKDGCCDSNCDSNHLFCPAAPARDSGHSWLDFSRDASANSSLGRGILTQFFFRPDLRLKIARGRADGEYLPSRSGSAETLVARVQNIGRATADPVYIFISILGGTDGFEPVLWLDRTIVKTGVQTRIRKAIRLDYTARGDSVLVYNSAAENNGWVQTLAVFEGLKLDRDKTYTVYLQVRAAQQQRRSNYWLFEMTLRKNGEIEFTRPKKVSLLHLLRRGLSF